MSAANVQLEAGGLLLPKTKVDEGASEPVVARTYLHPALGDRPVIRLASERLGQAEDLAMEFLGFGAPSISPPIALQQRRSLGFAEWALINDPGNARFALDLVKRMKAAARQARSKPGHAWDAYTEMAKELGRSARHFLPPFWEEAGRAFKDLGNPTYAGRALNKSLEAERVHALDSDRARRRDVVLEFVLSGCLSGNALSDYGNDLLNHSAPGEAFAIFRDLCVRRTRGGMAPWATMPKDFAKLAKAAGLKADDELETWLEETIDAPAMGRAPIQFWKSCSAHCKRIVDRDPAFAMALLRQTRPEPTYWTASTLRPWLEMLEEWGVFAFLWEDGHKGAPPLGEPIADWFGRVVRDDVPAPNYVLRMLEKLVPRLKAEGRPIPLSASGLYRATAIDIDVLETCLALGIPVADPPEGFEVTFAGWLSEKPDHPFRNRDIVEAPRDDRFTFAINKALDTALTCKGGTHERGYRQSGIAQRAFPASAGDRPGIMALWQRQASGIVGALEGSGLVSFELALERLQSTLWPDTLRLFPDLAERLRNIDLPAMLMRTLRAGVFDEYGLPSYDEVADRLDIRPQKSYSAGTIFLAFPNVVLIDKVRAHVIRGDGSIHPFELRMPKKSDLKEVIAVGDDLAVVYRDDHYNDHFFWASDPKQVHDLSYFSLRDETGLVSTPLGDGSYFLGQIAVRPGDKQPPQGHNTLHDGSRFWRIAFEYDEAIRSHRWKLAEVNPSTGKEIRQSVPPWFEETEGGEIELAGCDLIATTPGSETSPLGSKDGLHGWKAIKRRDGGHVGIGIDGRRWDRPLLGPDGSPALPLGLLQQPGTGEYLPVSQAPAHDENYWIWDPTGSTIVATLSNFGRDYAGGQPAILPIHFWHLMKPRDESSSRMLRTITPEKCAELFRSSAENRSREKAAARMPDENRLASLVEAVKKILPTAPERLAAGVAWIVDHAEFRASTYALLLEQATASSSQKASPAIAEDRLSDLAAEHWELDPFHIYGDEADEASVSAHLRASAEFLKGRAEAGDLPRTDRSWFGMLDNLPIRAWGTHWRALSAKMSKPEGGDVPWLGLLNLWHELGLDELPGRFDILQGVPEGTKKRSWGGYDLDIETGKSFAIRQGDDRFVAIEGASQLPDHLTHLFLRYSTAEKPGTPAGYTIKHTIPIKARNNPAEIAAFLEAAGACSQPPLPSREELEKAAANLCVSPAEIGLVWMAGLNLDAYESNFLPAELRKALGWKAAEANIARQALRNLDAKVRDLLYQSVLSGGAAAPFGDDRSAVLGRVEAAWRSKLPKRLQLDAALQNRLSVLGRTSSWHRIEHADLLTAAADPSKYPLLQPKAIRIDVEKERSHSSLGLVGKNKKEAIIDEDFLRSIAHLVAIVHAETPAGNPARASMPALIRRVTELLDDPGLLLQLRTAEFYGNDPKKDPKPSGWLDKHVGKTKPDAKTGTASLDDGLIAASSLDAQNTALLAFRPAKLKDRADVARLVGLLAIDAGEGYEPSCSAIPTTIALKSPGFHKLAVAILAEGIPEGQWPENPAHTAPDVVRQIQKKFGIGEDASILYAQLLALPEPTSANVCRWNGWTPARFKKASAELAGQKLVLEASRSRAGRPIFLPGEWVELKAPWLPIERWKLAHLVDLDIDIGPMDRQLAGGPLVLRPFGDLFEAAWKRIIGGDEPRYEEVQRKKKAK